MDLFEIKKDENTILFGTKLAENSAGDWVMEVKGTSEVIAVKPSLCEKVVPYTIRIKTSTVPSFHVKVSNEASLKEGDLIVLDSYEIAVVVELNTEKSPTANVNILGKIPMEAISQDGEKQNA